MNKRITLTLTGISMVLGVSAGAFLKQKNTNASIEVNAASGNTVSVEDYYSGIDPNSTTLLSDLQSLNKTYKKSTPGYDGLRTLYQKTDIDPDGSGKILGFYDNHLVGPDWDSGKTWNREHVWPDSIGGGSVDGDAHMPRPTWKQSNSSRGNSYYAESGAFDPGYDLPNYRGISARIIFYCMVANPQLKLEDDAKTNPKTGSNTMGKLSDMLKWNLEYLPTDSPTAAVELRCENNRNNVIQHEVQGNRNPFIDHPEYACKIWGNTNAATRAICGGSQTVTLSSISLSGSQKTSFEVNETFSYSGLVVTARYSDGSSKTVTPTNVSSPSMSTTGTKTITVSYTEGGVTKTATYTITVSNPAVHTTGLSLDKTNATIVVGNTITLVATKTPANSEDGITWSSSNSSIASVSNGVVRGVKEGTATITASSNNIKATCTITVAAQTVNVTGVTLNKNSLDLLVGGTDGQLTATVEPIDATNKEVRWTSSNPAVAIVDGGVVHAVGNGNTIITVTTDDGDFTATCNVSVTTPDVIVHAESVSLNFSSKSIKQGVSFTLEPTVLPENTTNKNVSWETSDPTIVSVNNGRVIGVNAGSATVTVTTQDGGLTASCNVTVTSVTPPAPVGERVMTELVINKLPDKTIYNVGEQFDKTGLEVSVNYLDGSNKVVTDYIIPSKPNVSIAGSKTVKVFYTENNKSVSTSFDVLYMEPDKTIDEIKLDGELLKTEYYVGDDLLLYGLNISVKLSDGSIVNASDLVTITYDLSEAGDASVTISLPGVKSISFAVTVKEGEPTATDEALDFTYEYIEKIPEEISDVTIKDWQILEHYFNTLDEEAQAVLRNYVTEYGGVKAGAQDNLSQVLTDYDEVILAKKSQGFSDFMGRNPKPREEEKEFNMLPIIIGGALLLILIGGIVAIVLVVKSKNKKLAN